MTTRRQFLHRGAAALAGLAGLGRLQAEDRGLIDEAAQQAIKQGLGYLVRTQHPDGSFGERHYRGNVAITSLAGLALMAGGHLPGRGPQGKVVADALKFVLRQEERNGRGFLHNPDASPHGPMYSHGFGTLFLAELHGMVHDPTLRQSLRDKLEKAIALIVRAQNSDGGWRYQPEPKDADISVTICQIMALRSARNAGFSVPKRTVERCIDYVKACQQSDGGFRYMKQGGPAAFARTAAGVCALQSAGIYEGDEIQLGLKYLMDYKPNQPFPRHPNIPDLHYFYGHYYAAQAMWTAGGDWWSQWYPAIRDELVTSRRRNSDNAWTDTICSHYATAMACIILQIPNNYLPILQK